MSNTKPLNMRCPTDVLTKVETMARADRRSVSGMAVRLIEIGLEQSGRVPAVAPQPETRNGAQTPQSLRFADERQREVAG